MHSLLVSAAGLNLELVSRFVHSCGQRALTVGVGCGKASSVPWMSKGAYDVALALYAHATGRQAPLVLAQRLNGACACLASTASQHSCIVLHACVKLIETDCLRVLSATKPVFSCSSGTLSGVIGVAVTGHILDWFGGSAVLSGWFQAHALAAIICLGATVIFFSFARGERCFN